ncbi:MAG: hypothetical protein COA36_16100 [Desulfotalea sp.]|nr:MAG: hypothetical protein COA36_16100 [Desulfotalea sp.]
MLLEEWRLYQRFMQQLKTTKNIFKEMNEGLWAFAAASKPFNYGFDAVAYYLRGPQYAQLEWRPRVIQKAILFCF